MNAIVRLGTLKKFKKAHWRFMAISIEENLASPFSRFLILRHWVEEHRYIKSNE